MLGEVIPEQLSQSMGIALYAMFIGLLVPSVKKELRVGLIAIIAMLINVIASQFVSSGWAIVFGTVLGGLAGVYLLKEKQTMICSYHNWYVTCDDGSKSNSSICCQ